MTARVEDVFADTEVASAGALLARVMGEPDCYGSGDDWEPTLASFRFAVGPTFGRFHMAFTTRVADAHRYYEGDGNLFGVLQMGAQGGVSF